ncbi:MAG: ArsR family transcriptional regulator, arsenate/arsenite/antimonite-responsive transcriptional [Actinomycetota bacterium]|nr:ArsR family transcriptional regulator, arsenate/arsenite/antimonite-responsive transcriptional [Actinomycetota bacterium]
MSAEVNRSLSGSDLEYRSRIFRALGDPTRLRIVELLRNRDLSPDTLAAQLGIAGNLVAHHLKSLETAGVISRSHSQNNRRRTYIHLVDGALDDLIPPSSTAAARVLFVCTHNSARSVLAEALWRTVSDVPCASAGTHPAPCVNPRAVSAARRAGLSLDACAPRSIEALLEADDLVVSVCDTVNEDLGQLVNERIHWSVPDPSHVDTDEAFTAAFADISARIRHLAPLVHPAQAK